MELCYALALVACLVQLIRTGYARRLPLFTAATVASLAFEACYQPYSLPWLRQWYPWLVSPLLLLRALAVAEAFVVSSRDFRQRRLIAAASVLLALLFASVIAWRFGGGDVLHSAIHARRVIVVGLAAFLGIYALLVWSAGYRRSGIIDAHVGLLFAVCAVMAAGSVARLAWPGGNWQAASDATYAACALIYLTWGASFSIPAPQPAPLHPGNSTQAA